MNEPLTDRYRPRTLAEVRGQRKIVISLQNFADNPYSAAFLFAGPTGVGKTCTALALANDLGIVVDQVEIGGLWQIASGDQTGESVRQAIEGLRVRPWRGSGWKMLLVNECDKMTEVASFVWLDVLESLPPQSVVVFTTNDPRKLPSRLRDRCETFEFEGNAMALNESMQEMLCDIWKAESARGDAPRIEELGPLTDDQGNVSFRRLLQKLSPLLRDGRPEVRPPLVSKVVPAAEPDTKSNVLWWIIGGSAVLAVGALSLAAMLISDGKLGGTSNHSDRGWTPDDLLR